MDIVFRSRRTNIPERFRQHAEGKLAKIGKLDHKAIRIDVEVTQERNPRQAKGRERVELTIRSRGPVVRAEAAADDRYTALDLAFAKLENRLRRSSERRKGARGAPPGPTRPPPPPPPGPPPGPRARTPPRSRTATGRLRPRTARTGRRPPPRTWCPSRWRATARWWSARSCTTPTP